MLAPYHNSSENMYQNYNAVSYYTRQNDNNQKGKIGVVVNKGKEAEKWECPSTIKGL